jgi:hypothetical protein
MRLRNATKKYHSGYCKPMSQWTQVQDGYSNLHCSSALSQNFRFHLHRVCQLISFLISCTNFRGYLRNYKINADGGELGGRWTKGLIVHLYRNIHSPGGKTKVQQWNKFLQLAAPIPLRGSDPSLSCGVPSDGCHIFTVIIHSGRI